VHGANWRERAEPTRRPRQPVIRHHFARSNEPARSGRGKRRGCRPTAAAASKR